MTKIDEAISLIRIDVRHHFSKRGRSFNVVDCDSVDEILEYVQVRLNQCVKELERGQG